jgi:hypothetical protein
MNEQASIVIIICSIATVVGVLIALNVQRHRLHRLRALFLMWEQEQVRGQQFWEVQQEKCMGELETHYTTQMQQLQGTWHHWEAEDKMLVATQRQQYEQEIVRMKLEYELLRLPRIEDVPLP